MNRFRFILFSFIAISTNLALVGVQVAKSNLVNDAKPAFSLGVSTDRDVYKINSEIRVRIILTNISDREINIERELGTSAGEFNYDVEVRLENGTMASSTKYHKILKGEPGAGSMIIVSSTIIFPIKPTEVVEDGITINKLFDMDKVGKYQIQVSRIDRVSKALVKSNVITVTVVPDTTDKSK